VTDLRPMRGTGWGRILVFVCGGTCRGQWGSGMDGVHKDYKERSKVMKADGLLRNLRTTMLLPWEALRTYRRGPSPSSLAPWRAWCDHTPTHSRGSRRGP